MRKILGTIALLVISFIVFNSCRKDFSNEQYTPTVTQPTKVDLGTTITTSVTGFVTDENNHAVLGATVTAGGLTALTDSFGFFTIKNALLPQIAGFVKVNYPGYFTGYKTFICTVSKTMFTRIKLIPKINTGSINASSGGSVTSTDGAIVTLPVNGVVVASGNTAYSGTVSVATHWINPTDIDAITLNMPGDLRGIDTVNNIQGLNSYGMLAVELTGSGGQLLQIATGKQATLSFPIPPSLLTSAPASIPLWSFNDTNGLWKEEGFATKIGTNYVGNVAHFSYWNCDMPFGAGVTLQTQLVDSALHPLANTCVEIVSQDGAYTGCHGYTDSSGFIYGFVPANSNLQLNVQAMPCYSSIFSKNFSTTTVNIDLGTIIPTSNQHQIYTIRGTVVDCSNAPVTNGSIILMPSDFSGYINAPLINGSFSISPLSCANTTYSIVAINNSTLQATLPQLLTLTPGINNIGSIAICGTVSDQYLSFTLDGVTTNLPVPSVDTGGVYVLSPFQTPGMPPMFGDSGGDSTRLWIYLQSLNYNGISGGSFTMEQGAWTTAADPNVYAGLIEDYTTSLPRDYEYQPTGYGTTNYVPTPINITHFGDVGDYITGSFSYPSSKRSQDSTIHTISVSFKLIRKQ